MRFLESSVAARLNVIEVSRGPRVRRGVDLDRRQVDLVPAYGGSLAIPLLVLPRFAMLIKEGFSSAYLRVLFMTIVSVKL